MKAEKVTTKAERKSETVKSDVMAIQEVRKNTVKPGKKTFKAEAEQGRGTRTKTVPPPGESKVKQSRGGQQNMKMQKSVQQNDNSG